MTTRIGIMGGTFNPIHLGHLIVAGSAASELELDRVLFMPAQTPPHKRSGEILEAGHRAAMVQQAIERDSRFEYSDLDLLVDRPSYTAELLVRVSKRHPEADISFIIGADSLRDFPTWYQPTDILSIAKLAVARRPGVPIDETMLGALPSLRQRTVLFDSPLIEISSTDIRTRVSNGKRITWLVPESVERYIEKHRLYV